MGTFLNSAQKSPQQLTQLALDLVKQEKIDQAIDILQLSLAADPGQVLANYFLANCYKIQRQPKQASEYYAKTLQLDPTFHPARWGQCICQIPEFYQSEDQIETSRKAYSEQLHEIDRLTATGDEKALKMGAQVVGSFYPFFLPYQNQDDGQLQKLHGKIAHRCMSFQYPQWSQPLAMPTLKEGERLRVGFVSKHFSNHSVWKIPLQGWLQGLNPKHFQLFAYLPGPQQQENHDLAKGLVHAFVEGLSFEDLAARIKADNLHALIYPEIGMDPSTTRLACLRLAPIQCTSLGHPQTSGLPTIDYFLSSELMEPDSPASYSETLIKLPHLSIYYTPNHFGFQDRDWQELGIRADSVKYLCCQSLFKYLPQYDWVWPAIAKRVPNAQFIFINYPTSLGEAMQQRLEKAFHKENLDAKKHTVLLPRLASSEWTALLGHCDLALDSIGWSGFNSTAEALEQGLVVVTYPGKWMRSRHTSALLNFLKVPQAITSSLEEYVELAVTLGQDSSKRQALKEQVSSTISKLYYDRAPIEALERFLKEKVDAGLKPL